MFQFTVDHMQIGAADPAGRNLDQQFSRPGRRHRPLAHDERRPGLSSTMARIAAIIRPSNSPADILDQITMRTDIAQPIRLKDYRPPDWLVETVSLDFSLHPTADQGARDPEAQAQSGHARPRRWCSMATG